MERSKDWMEQAEWDLEHALHDLEHGFYDWACFSAQQAAEKATKAVFQKQGAVAWGHSVAELLRELQRHFDIPQSLIEAAMELDQAYVPSLYPNVLPAGAPKGAFTEGQAKRLINYAGEILRVCKDILSGMD
ncbi:MAG: HEPN domain-containing protein [Anaerolineae bacterium]|nr:HEPN domain-containing protein [Anaerolineae bacterium]MDW8101283.1 HEPN domain-containing protein [Anaerolineae bacterium]